MSVNPDDPTVRATIAEVIAWLRSPNQNGHAHTHTIARDLERGDWWNEMPETPEPGVAAGDASEEQA